jgi:hypothetical protein
VVQAAATNTNKQEGFFPSIQTPEKPSPAHLKTLTQITANFLYDQSFYETNYFQSSTNPAHLDAFIILAASTLP